MLDRCIERVPLPPSFHPLLSLPLDNRSLGNIDIDIDVWPICIQVKRPSNHVSNPLATNLLALPTLPPRLIIRREKLRFSRYTWPSPPPLPLFPSLPFKERKSELIFHFTSSKVMTLLPHCQKSRVDINIGGGDVGDTN